MNPYQFLIPQLLAGLAIVAVALRATRQARRENEASKEDITKRRAELEHSLAQLNEAIANPAIPASTFVTEWAKAPILRVTLDLADHDSVTDVAQMAKNAGHLIAGLSAYETAIGGRGLILTGAVAEPGQVVLTLTPKDAIGATDRVRRVADALNAAFDSVDRPAGESAPDLGRLPRDVAGAHAIALAA